MKRHGRIFFKPRECFICGSMISKMEDAKFLPMEENDKSSDQDVNGYCATHGVGDVVKKINGRYELKSLFIMTTESRSLLYRLRRFVNGP